MTRFAFAIIAALSLAGCVAVWGRAYDVEAADAKAVDIKYDAHFTSADNIKRVAQSSCDEYDKVAVAQQESTSVWGITTARFACVMRQQ